MNDDRPITNAQLALLMACTVTLPLLPAVVTLIDALIRFTDAADDSEGGAS